MSDEKNRTYLIAETTFDSKISEADILQIQETIKKAIPAQLSKIGLTKNIRINSISQNIERYVYPIQDHKNKLRSKEICNFYHTRNIEHMGTGANFMYNDIQVIFKQAKDLANSLACITADSQLTRLSFNLNRNTSTKRLKKNYSYSNQKSSSTKIIAEIGINHNGSAERLTELINKCASTVDIVKFQYFNSSKRIGSNVKELNYVEKSQDIEEDIKELLERCEISEQELEDAYQYVKEKGKEAMCTVFDKSDLKTLLNIGFTHIEVASMDLNNYELHREIAETRQPLSVYISTGMSTIEEITAAVDIYNDTHHNLTVMACTSSYRLRKMR